MLIYCCTNRFVVSVPGSLVLFIWDLEKFGKPCWFFATDELCFPLSIKLGHVEPAEFLGFLFAMWGGKSEPPG